MIGIGMAIVLLAQQILDFACIPPRTQEANQLILLRLQAVDYLNRHGHLPQTLADMKDECDGRWFCGGFGIDSQGQPIQYERHGDTNFTLRITGPWHQPHRRMRDELAAEWTAGAPLP